MNLNPSYTCDQRFSACLLTNKDARPPPSRSSFRPTKTPHPLPDGLMMRSTKRRWDVTRSRRHSTFVHSSPRCGAVTSRKSLWGQAQSPSCTNSFRQHRARGTTSFLRGEPSRPTRGQRSSPVRKPAKSPTCPTTATTLTRWQRQSTTEPGSSCCAPRTIQRGPPSRQRISSDS